MSRDELILSCQETIGNLVRKYNNHKPDEDLQAVGMTAVIECVDRSLNEGLTDVEQIQARCNKWARNAILDEIYREKIKYVEDNSPLEHIESEEDLWETTQVIKSYLSPRENDMFSLLLAGCSLEEICEKLTITQPTYYEHYRNLKKKIYNTTHNFDE